jgi:hypothetical protein
MAAKSPDSYTCTEAARLLGVSARRIRQLAEEGRLGIVQESPLRVSAGEVITLRDSRKKQGIKVKPSSPKSSLNLELLEALQAAREAGAQEAKSSLELLGNELRERAERAEQRAAEAEQARLVSESTKAALEARLEALESRSWIARLRR